MKYVQKHFWRERLCALYVFLCAHVSRPVCASRRAQFRGNIGQDRSHHDTSVLGGKPVIGVIDIEGLGSAAGGKLGDLK